jgi:hypothetical protein
MNEALAFYGTKTVPAFPLGQPTDGRPRYGMTPEQACLYRWLVKHKPHDGPFGINFRGTAWRMARHGSAIHKTVCALVERGWLHHIEAANHMDVAYAFVHPVMNFRGPRHG